MTNGIKEKDIRDMQKCFDKIETILKRIQVYNPEARIICIESDTIALVNFNGEFIDSAPQIKDEHIDGTQRTTKIEDYRSGKIPL